MRIHTDLEVIRRALDMVDGGMSDAAAGRVLGRHHSTIARWRRQRDRRAPEWPTPDDIAAWKADDEAKREIRAHKNAIQLDLRKRTYLDRGPAMIPNVGTRRRLQALQAIGWPATEIARRLGVCAQRVSFMSSGRYARVTRPMAAKVAALYDEISMIVPVDTPPPNPRRGHCPIHERTRSIARKKNWFPPLAWEDDELDDPTVTRNPVRKRVRGDKTCNARGQLAEEVIELLDDNRTLTSRMICDRLGVSDVDRITQALRRAGRQDLIALLARNAGIDPNRRKKAS